MIRPLYIRTAQVNSISAGLLTKVASPVVGATKLHHIEGAEKAVRLALTGEECAYLEEPYLPHRLVGVMSQNAEVSSKKSHVWLTVPPHRTFLKDCDMER